MKNMGMDIDKHGNTEKLKNWLKEPSIRLDEHVHATSPVFNGQALRPLKT